MSANRTARAVAAPGGGPAEITEAFSAVTLMAHVEQHYGLPQERRG